MDDTKETGVQKQGESCSVKLVMGILAFPIGYATSYWFQSEFVRAKCSLFDYFIHIKDVLTTRETAPTAIIVTIIVGFIVAAIGDRLAARSK